MSVGGIFKTLIKVPIIIIVCFAIFNVFAFSLTYMKMMGMSYVALQTAMDNNYMPMGGEGGKLGIYLQNMNNGVMSNTGFTSGTTKIKQQYGEEVTVGVQTDYKFIWPLTPKEEIQSGELGLNKTGNITFKSDAELNALRAEKEGSGDKANTIKIEYKVPGLKYYPDLDN